MGSLWRRGRIYYADYYHQGKRVRERVGPSKTLAKQVLSKREAEIAEGRFFPNRKNASITVQEMIRMYWDLHGKFRKGHAHGPVLRRLDREFGALPLNRITVQMAVEYRNRVREATSVANANRHMTIFRALFNRAKEWDKFAGDNPISKVKQEKEENRRLRFLDHEEIKRLLVASHPRLMPVVVCALLTGMRKGEILGLQWDNVDLKLGIIYILKAKSGKAREIPMSSRLVELFGFLGPKSAGPVFDIPEISMRRYFARALTDARILGFRFHDLRHTFASHYIMKTGDLLALQRLLGHHSVSMTQRYAHLSPGHMRSGIQQLDNELGHSLVTMDPAPRLGAP